MGWSRDGLNDDGAVRAARVAACLRTDRAAVAAASARPGPRGRDFAVVHVHEVPEAVHDDEVFRLVGAALAHGLPATSVLAFDALCVIAGRDGA